MVALEKLASPAAVGCHACVQVAKKQDGVASPRAISLREMGENGSLDYRVFFQNDHKDISPWHSVPLYAGGDGLLNFVCEIPQNTRAKFEVSTTEVHNPIKQDEKKGKPRYYPMNIEWNYGMLPQTWEDPLHASHDCGGAIGDCDPVDVVEISGRALKTGEVAKVKPFGILAMIDEGELDWKVIAINAEDPRADLCHDIEDVELHFPGELSRVREWFRNYKIPDGKPPNQFELGEKFMDREYTMGVIAQTHGFWAGLVMARRNGMLPPGSKGLEMAVEGAPPPVPAGELCSTHLGAKRTRTHPLPEARRISVMTSPAYSPEVAAAGKLGLGHPHGSSNSILESNLMLSSESESVSDENSDDEDASKSDRNRRTFASAFICNGNTGKSGFSGLSKTMGGLGRAFGGLPSLKRKPSKDLMLSMGEASHANEAPAGSEEVKEDAHNRVAVRVTA